MANTRGGNVIRIDTTAAFPDVRSVDAIKYIGQTDGTAVIKADSNSGATVWEHLGNVIAQDDVNIRCQSGIHVTVTNGAVVYIYCKV